MLTLESKFSDYVEALRKAGACEPVVAIHDEMLKKNPDLTVGDVYRTFSEDPKFEEGWAYWVLELMGDELDTKIRKIAIGKITSPKIALTLMQISKIFTEEEITLLKAVYKGKLTSTDIKEPMDAFRLYVGCAPILTESESLSLKSIFDGKLPVAEKELRDGIVTRATAEVAP